MRTLLAATALFLAAAPAAADIDVRAQLGLGGRWIVEAATPLVVELRNTGAEPVAVEITVSPGQGMMSSDIVHRRVVQIGAGASRQELFVVPGAPLWGGGTGVSLETDPAVAIHSPAKSSDRGSLSFDVTGAGGLNISGGQIQYAERVLGVVGDARGAISSRITALGLAASADQRDSRACRRIDSVDVPAELLRLAPLGLGGIDALLLCDPDAQVGADPAVRDAILDWVALGGTLAVSLGEHAGQFTASPLAADMPASWTGAGRTSYASLLAEVGAKPGRAEFPGPWTVLAPRAGAQVADADSHDGAPRCVTRELGLGRIVLLAFDVRTALSAPWMQEADGRAVLAPFLRAAEPLPPRDEQYWYQETFADPVARTLQAGAFEPPPLGLVVLGIVLYVVVVGPLDWIVLRRMKKERLTTLTFLGAVAAFTLLAYGSSFLIFSSGPRVNRLVLADLVEAGRDGRQLLRFVDIAGYYSSTGADQTLQYPAQAVVLPAALPGMGMGGAVGAALPIEVASVDPLRPKAVVQLAFRSQRTVRIESSGTIGPTIDVEWKDGGVRVVNGLPVDLDDVAVYTSEDAAYSLGRVASGQTSNDGGFTSAKSIRNRSYGGAEGRTPWDDDGTPVDARRLLEAMTLGPPKSGQGKGPQVDDVRSSLRKAGIDRSAAFGRHRALLVAHASKFPAALPGAQVQGATYVVFRKEVEIP